MPKVIEAFDKIGQSITVGDIVVAPISASTTVIARVEKVTPKQVKLHRLCGTSSIRSYKNHSQVIVITPLEQTVMYLLENR